MSARLLPLVPGGPLDLRTIAALYGILREPDPFDIGQVPAHGVLSAARKAVVLDWLAWRRAREAQRGDA